MCCHPKQRRKWSLHEFPFPSTTSVAAVSRLYGPWFTNVPRICETPGVFHVRTGDKPGDTRGPERNRYCHSVFITLQASNRLPLSLVLTPTGQCTHRAIRVDQVLGTWPNNRLTRKSGVTLVPTAFAGRQVYEMPTRPSHWPAEPDGDG
jgi:hypothetical protein